MEIVKTFGNYIEKWCETSPERARWLLKTGWEAQNLKFRFLPEGQLNQADEQVIRDIGSLQEGMPAQAVDASAEGVDGADAVPADAEDVVTETEEGA